MNIYRVTMKGRSPFLMKAEGVSDVKDALVTVDKLSAKDLADEFGAPVIGVGDELPAIKAEAAGESQANEEQE